MKINVESTQEGGAFFVNFTHVRDGKNYHTYIRLENIKSWESTTESRQADRATRWILETMQGDRYYTLSNFNHIMSTVTWFPRPSDGRGNGRIGDTYLYDEKEEKYDAPQS